MAVEAEYAGSYGNGGADGTYDQDFVGGAVVGPNTTITLFGNAWKAYELKTPYKLSQYSKLQFDFWMFTEAEGHAICVDDDINEDTFGGQRIRCFMLGGSEFDKWYHVIKLNRSGYDAHIEPGEIENRYDLCESERRITLPLRTLFLDQDVKKIKYIAFIQDNDKDPTYGESAFENIVLFEDLQGEVHYVSYRGRTFAAFHVFNHFHLFDHYYSATSVENNYHR